MKKILALLICALLTLGTMTVAIVSAEESKGAPTGFTVGQALYAHAVTGSEDGEAWQAWQSEHDEDINEHDPSVRYFFLPTSADESKADIYNGYSEAVTVAGTTIPACETATVSYVKGENYTVAAGGSSYTLKFMKSNAEAAIYINNSNADGNGAELMNYLNSDKANSATARQDRQHPCQEDQGSRQYQLGQAEKRLQRHLRQEGEHCRHGEKQEILAACQLSGRFSLPQPLPL